jgi:hypothetical protein
LFVSPKAAESAPTPLYVVEGRTARAERQRLSTLAERVASSVVT